MIGILALICATFCLSAPSEDDRCLVIYEPYGKDGYYLLWFDHPKF